MARQSKHRVLDLTTVTSGVHDIIVLVNDLNVALDKAEDAASRHVELRNGKAVVK